MNILLVNPDYPDSFWSFNRVLRLLGKRVLLPPLGLITVAAQLPDTWNFRLVELTHRELSEADWEFADAVLITGMYNQSPGVFRTIREAKEKGKYVVVGGPFAYHSAEDLTAFGADLVFKGETEEATDELVSAMVRRDSGRIIQSDGFPSLENIPIPRYDLLDIDLYMDMPLQFSRGCPFQCEFCDITLMYGRRVRTKSPEQVLRELQAIYDLGWRRAVFFVDDNFIGAPSKASELLDKLLPWMEEHHFPFDYYTQASVNLADHSKLLDMMSRSGFYRVFLGIETTDVESLKITKKHQNAAADLDEVCRKINKAGLQIISGCIIGFDNEQKGSDKRLIDFATRNSIPEMFISILEAAPGTELWRRLENEGRLLSADRRPEVICQAGGMNFASTRPSREIVSEFINMFDVLYESNFFLDRTYRHFRSMDARPVKKPFMLPYISELRAVLFTFIRLGIVSSSRWKFWKYLIGGLFRFPDRIHFYLASCVTHEHYADFRHTLKERMRSGVDDVEQDKRRFADNVEI